MSTKKRNLKRNVRLPKRYEGSVSVVSRTTYIAQITKLKLKWLLGMRISLLIGVMKRIIIQGKGE